jgi:hypothetical protein
MNFVGMGSYEIVSRGAVAWLIGFLFLRESFFPVAFSAHTVPVVDISQKRVVGDLSFSGL